MKSNRRKREQPVMMPEIRVINTDILIIGSGAAGTMAAIKAMAEGAEVLVVTKGPFPSGNTSIVHQ